MIGVDPMDDKEGLALLKKKLSYDFAEEAALQLLRELDNMPLAITQASAYISRWGARGTIDRYLKLFRDSERSKAKLLKVNIGDLRRDSDRSHSILITWQISFDQIRKQRSSAAKLLSIMSFFNRLGIPAFVLQASVDNDSANLEFEEDIATLISYCLIKGEDRGDTFEMHRLVQFATKAWLERYGEWNSSRRKFLAALSVEFPHGRLECWSSGQALFPHAEMALERTPSNEDSLLSWSDLLRKASWYAYRNGRLDLGEDMARKALRASEQVLGPEDKRTLRSVHYLGLVLHNQGRLDTAEELHLRAANGAQSILGENHPTTLLYRRNLARVIDDQGRYKEAEDILRQALAITEEIEEAYSLYTLEVMHCLGKSLSFQGKYNEAEGIIQRVVEEYKNLVAENNLGLLYSMRLLGSILFRQGKYERAEAVYRQVFNECKKSYGSTHHLTFISESGLAEVLSRQGKHEDALEHSQHALSELEQIFGENYMETLQAEECLARIWWDQGNYGEAERIYRNVVHKSEKSVGKSHRSTLLSSRGFGTRSARSGQI